MTLLCNSNVIGGEVDTGDIGHSLRFRSAASAYLNRTPGAGSTTAWALSLWVKRGALGTERPLFAATSSGTNYNIFEFNSSDQLYFVNRPSGGVNVSLTTTRVFRDPTSWIHLFLVYDSANATQTDRVRLEVNGVRETSFSSPTWPTSSLASIIETAIAHYIGNTGLGAFADQYMSRIAFITGNGSLSASSVGYLNTEINEWVSKSASAVKAVVDAGGANSFMLDFHDATSLTTLGYDKSSKGNNWTLNNFSLTAGANYDVSGDVPGNSIATWNPLDVRASGITFSAGNRSMAYGSAAWRTACSTIAVTSGKWYAEADATQLGAGTALIFGCSTLAGLTNTSNLGDWSGSIGIGKGTAGPIFAVQASYPSAPHTIAANDRNLIAIDCDAGKAWLGYYDSSVPSTTWYSSAGAATGDPVAGTNPTMTFTAGTPMVIAQGIYNTSTAYAAYFGDDNLAGTRPTGFKALCQRNMPDPAILNPEKHFDVLLHTGGASSAQDVTGAQFQPDLAWIKDRSAARSHGLFDSIRGATTYLASDLTSAESVRNGQVFLSNGFRVDRQSGQETNTNGETYVDWLWKAGGAAVTNNAGSISSQVSANTTAGFSIVTYTGTGANASVGHGLNKAPSIVIVKDRTAASANNWAVGHNGLSNWGWALKLNLTDAQANYAAFWSNPSSSVFYPSTDNSTNQSGHTYVAYCFAEIPGFSKIFSYTGNGSADGPFVHCGFKPKYVLIKRVDAANSWTVVDSVRNTYNVIGEWLAPNSSGAETTYAGWDFTSSGFKLRNTSPTYNASGGTYIGIAFADVSAKFSLGR